MIAPRRFNPERVAWLPVLHTELAGYHVTALFSNTARAHALGTTRDWVVITYEQTRGEGQCTVVTERRGALSGLRVVRGREAECLEEHTRSFAQAKRHLRAARRQIEA
jgi:putative hydrolase